MRKSPSVERLESSLSSSTAMIWIHFPGSLPCDTPFLLCIHLVVGSRGGGRGGVAAPGNAVDAAAAVMFAP